MVDRHEHSEPSIGPAPLAAVAKSQAVLKALVCSDVNPFLRRRFDLKVAGHAVSESNRRAGPLSAELGAPLSRRDA